MHNKGKMRQQIKETEYMHPSDRALSVAAEDLDIQFRGEMPVPWADFFLNPRRLRGSDFLMRWSQGVWSEERLIQAVNDTDKYFALPYGPSGVASENDVRATELYFERLEQAGLGQLKRPDLMIYRKSDEAEVKESVERLGGNGELPFTSEDDAVMRNLLSRAILAVEGENSLWRARQMPHYEAALRPMRRLGGQLGLPKSAILPTIIMKEEDRDALREWQQQRGVNIHIWHVFFDMAFGIAFDTAEALINSGKIEPSEQPFSLPGGASSKKTIYKFYYHYAYPLGDAHEEPTLVPDYIEEKNGHILPYVRLDCGRLALSTEAMEVLDQVAAWDEERA